MPSFDANRIIACDVGNSRIKIGLFAPSAGALPECLRSLTFDVAQPVDWEAVQGWERESGENTALHAVIAGANPGLLDRIVKEWSANIPVTRPVHIAELSQSILKVAVDEPAKVGVDRLLNSIAANVIRPDGSPAIIVDSGTATTVDLVDADGAFRGGAILPGLELAARSLHEYTALLPYIAMSEFNSEGTPALGTNTAAAIRSGLLWGQIGAVKELVERLGRSTVTGSELPPLVLITGGGGELLAPHLSQARWEPHLSLQGLCLAADCRPGDK